MVKQVEDPSDNGFPDSDGALWIFVGTISLPGVVAFLALIKEVFS